MMATSYKLAFEGLLEMKLTDEVKVQLIRIEKEGYSEKGICFAIYKTQDKLTKFKRDSRFWSILLNEVRKHCFKKDDPRWEVINQRKLRNKEYAEQVKQNKLQQRILSPEQYKPGKNKMYVYFVQGEKGGPIKIGTSKDVNKRLHALHTGFPVKLKLLAVLPGNERVECGLHQRFKEFRLSGEWFRPVKELLEYIKTLQTA